VSVPPPVRHVSKLARDHRAQLHGGGVEGDMLFPPGFDPKSSARGVAISGNRQWPNGEIPYDMSAITGTPLRKL